MTSHDGSHDKCGKVVHRPCSNCISIISQCDYDNSDEQDQLMERNNKMT